MITASALAPNCAYPRVLKARKQITSEQQAAIDAGVIFHKAVEAWVHTGEQQTVDDLEIQGWLDLLASMWTPPTDAEVEIAWGIAATWETLADGTYGPVTYVGRDVAELEPHVYAEKTGLPLLTAGRADLAFERRGALYVVDWKTGKWPVTPAVDNLQVNAAGIALAQMRGLTSYVPAVYYVRDGHFDEGEEVPLGSAAHAAIFREVYEAATLDDTPRLGTWCNRCWEKKACQAYARAIVAAEMTGPEQWAAATGRSDPWDT